MDEASPAAAGDPQGRRERRRAFFVRMVIGGLALVPASLVIAGATGNASGFFFWLVPALVATIVAAIVGVTGRFLVPALVISIVLFLFSFYLSESELTHPGSFSDFVPTVWRLAGTAAAAIGATVAMRQRRRGTLRPAAPRERLAVRIAVLALITLSVGSFALGSVSRTTIARADGAIVVNARSDSFDPDELRAGTGRVRFLVRNTDSYAHTFSIDKLELDEYIAPRSDRIVTVTIRRSGTYELYCAVTGHEGMAATIEVG